MRPPGLTEFLEKQVFRKKLLAPPSGEGLRWGELIEFSATHVMTEELL